MKIVSPLIWTSIAKEYDKPLPHPASCCETCAGIVKGEVIKVGEESDRLKALEAIISAPQIEVVKAAGDVEEMCVETRKSNKVPFF